MFLNTEIEIEKLLRGEQHNPHLVLGPHLLPAAAGGAVIRSFQPHAVNMWILAGGEEFLMLKTKDEGLFETTLASTPSPSSYRFRMEWGDGSQTERHDPYAFPPLLSDYDRYLFSHGTHYQLYRKMGAQLQTIGGVSGVVFRVWAPNARRVSLLGHFNGWDGRVHPLRVMESSGIWEIFLPDIGEFELYKYEILGCDGVLRVKTDPCQYSGELRPAKSSLVADLGSWQWNDANWMEARGRSQPHGRPVSIYELHLGSWRRDPANAERFLSFGEIAEALIPHVKNMGFTHIELMPVMEHPLDESWGYQVTGYFSVSSRHGSPSDFMEFIDRCHQENIGVILDWVPAHFPTDAESLVRFDGTALYEHEDPRLGFHPDWGTCIFNYGRREVANFLIANALFWLDVYHVDGLRVDAVASMLYLDYSRKDGEWLPNPHGGRENLDAIEFLRHLNSVVYAQHPGVMIIAEESTSFYGVSRPTNQGGLGFGFKWNMGWMNDTLVYFGRDPLFRKYHHNNLTFSLLYAFSENFILPLSHDEVVHGKGSLLDKMTGDIWQKFAGLRLLYLYLWTHPGKKMLFMGGEFGQWNEWDCKRSLDWHLAESDSPHRSLLGFIGALNSLYRRFPALWELDASHEGFQWLNCDDADNSILVFARYARNRNDHLVVLLNFTAQVHRSYKMGVPADCSYHEILNSDTERFGGSGIGNNKPLLPIPQRLGHAQCHVIVAVPPMAGVVFAPSSASW